MKKIFLSLFSLFLVFGFCIGCQKEEEPVKEEKSEDKIEGYAYHVGYLSDLENGSGVVLDDFNSFRNYFEKNANFVFDGEGNIVSATYDNIFDKYDERFFENNSLAVKYISLSSGSITITDVYGKINGNEVIINYKEHIPEIGTMDMSGYFLIVEVSNNITGVE